MPMLAGDGAARRAQRRQSAGAPLHAKTTGGCWRSSPDQIGVAVQNARLHVVMRPGKQQWEATFDAIGDPIAVFDRHGRLLRGNTALAAYLERAGDRRCAG